MTDSNSSIPPTDPRNDDAPTSSDLTHRDSYTSRRMTTPVSWVVTALALGAMCVLFWLDVVRDTEFNASIVYPVVLVACFWARQRWVLWTLFTLAVVFTISAYWMEEANTVRRLHRFLMLASLGVLTVVFDNLMMAWDETLRRQDLLEAGNIELAAREIEIARQNEELQSQTEELERQSEELTVANEELSRRERSVSVLLELSRGISIDTSRDEAMERICNTLRALLEGSDVATAILLRERDVLRIACHTGFGEGGLESETLPLDSSFAALVFSHGRTGFLEDLSLRPDLKVPTPKNGSPIVSVISAPLRVDGKLVGAIEGYGTHRRAWTAEQVALIESLANQTASTIRAEELFEHMKREREKFQTVFRAAPVGVVLTNLKTQTMRYNSTGGAMLGLPAETEIPVGEVFKQLKVFRNGQRYADITQETHTNGDISGEEIEIVLKNGKRITVLLGASPLPEKDDEGQTQSIVSAFVEITQIKELQRELDLRRREAEEASVRKTRFLAAVSHDVRTPANAISLLAELIRRTSGLPGRESEIAEMARELHSSAMALVNLLGDVLDVTRFDAGRVELQESEFDLRQLLESESQHLMPLARDKNLPFTLSAGPSIWVRADKVKLARVIGNLAGNAIKFTTTGQVSINYRREDDGRVRIEVTDTGVGIAAEQLQFIFDEFFQLRNPERDRNKGNGLGLTICKRLADAMSADLKVTSTEGKGSTFSVILPASAVMAQP